MAESLKYKQVYLKYTMKVTTVKLHMGTKSALDEIRKGSESYDEVIGKLVAVAKGRELKKELIAAYKCLGNADLDILEEWESASV